MTEKRTYTPLTVRMALDLAAPHTWAAAIIPAAFGYCLALSRGPASAVLAIVMLVIVVLMQSSVNTFNDYFDFIKGTDSENDSVEASDAILVYNAVNPRSVLGLGIAMLVCAFLLGIFPIIEAGIIPLLIGLVGGIIVVLYSAGRKPISYLPLGEVTSGFVMGGLIPLAFVAVLTGVLDPFVLLEAIPLMIGIGLIMATNNISDIERDEKANRSTLAVHLGRPRARQFYGWTIALWFVSLTLAGLMVFPGGWSLLPFAFLASLPFILNLRDGKLEPNARPRSMAAIAALNLILGLFYCAMVLL